MSKRVQLLLAGGVLSGVIAALVAMLVVVMTRSDEQNAALEDTAHVWAPTHVAEEAVDPWADRSVLALQRVWRRPGAPDPGVPDSERTIRQVVESDLMQEMFSGLRWDRLERVGWSAFQLEESVYETQFLYRDGSVELGPAWLVQLDQEGLQPEGSGGVVPANIFAEVIQRGASPELARYLNRQDEVLAALTNHQFEQGARLASGLLVYLCSRGQATSAEGITGWTVVPERVVPDGVTLYRASFQWRENDRDVVAAWEVNADTHAFRGLNLVASDVMAMGDTIRRDDLVSLRPVTLSEEPSDDEGNVYRALRLIVDDDRLLEALASLLWDRGRHGASIDPTIQQRPNGEFGLHWAADPIAGESGNYTIGYRYREDDVERELRWRIELEGPRVLPRDALASLAQVALVYNTVLPPGEPDD